MVGRFDPAPVSKQLDVSLAFLPPGATAAAEVQIRGPLERFVSTVLRPHAAGWLLTRTRANKADWIGQLYEAVDVTKWDYVDVTRYVVFASFDSSDRWAVAHAGKYPVVRRNFYSAVGELVDASRITHWCFV